jgi:peptidoglycan/LPS O-acetylase OafA/YrhL
MPDLPRITADDIPAPRPIEPFSTRPVPVVVSALPSWADLGERPVVTLTFADRMQLRIEQSRLTYAILSASVSIILAIDTISGYLTMNETPWYTQRRIWATILGIIATVLTVFKVTVPEWLTTVAPDLLVQIATAVASAIAGILAAWSYVKPKTETKP